MTNSNDLNRLYTGSEINVNILKEILDDNQIASLVKNDMKSGITAGFGGGYTGAESSIYVTDKNLEKAKIVLAEFLKSLEIS
ncbi:MAG: DUF2007 domain-containing protein [Bacteroidales bacterium]|jgi:hypothetical protein|nr:DUF2007 domain-containing protein [Bacteroidales bacterium]